jgi:flagellar biosynthesis component FlhA
MYSEWKYAPGVSVAVATGLIVSRICDRDAVTVDVMEPCVPGVLVMLMSGVPVSVALALTTYSHVVFWLIGYGVCPPGAVVVKVNSHSWSDPAGILKVHACTLLLLATGYPPVPG